MPRCRRRAFFAKVAAAVGVAALLPRPLRAALQLDSPKITDGDFSGHATIPAGKTLTIKAGATIRAETGANILGWPTGGNGSGDGNGGDTATAPKFALFEIPLGIYGPEWTDFELKGSINNFTGLAAEALCYFYGSAYGNGQSTHGRIGETLAVFFTDDLGGEDHGLARQWRVQNRSLSIFEQRLTPNSRIGGVLVVVPVGGEIRPDNERLRFVWQRVSAARMEQCWVPVTPKWSVEAPLAEGGGSGSGGSGREAYLYQRTSLFARYIPLRDGDTLPVFTVTNESNWTLTLDCVTERYAKTTLPSGSVSEGWGRVETIVSIPAGKTESITFANVPNHTGGSVHFDAIPTFVGAPQPPPRPPWTPSEDSPRAKVHASKNEFGREYYGWGIQPTY